ncbi:MAG TPA: UDP-N-acetylglucosamine--N-acetylmuramyl-(pentapeptide) pyrophosphoryl-undecaprenol N-acetylglucosamine transferase [Bryobacteraceae bacterium]|nr:UDP-N-acetylglucosamine--N-acetylmuramyl-(pentapeptide) pyrophosphoryl-undecaprenol N-acetylglucosamine transferase [Bryobacteraceae bacterium]
MELAAKRIIAVAGGGTAGHILPAIDVLRAYRREFGAAGFFIGCASGLETRLVPAHGERLELVPGLPWARQGLAGKLRAIASVPAGILAARRILRREKIQLLVGVGGYATFGACMAAVSLGIPVVIHEANAEPGLANRLAARFASLVCAGFAETAARFAAKVEITGTPAGSITRASHNDAPPWRFLVLGGSEGSPVLNRQAPVLFAELRRRGMAFTVRHISGFGDAAAIARAYGQAGVDVRVDSFVDDMASVYNGATLAIASAGARSMAELSAAAIPSFLVPLPGAANDHQTANAVAYSARTGAAVIPESQWDTGQVAARIEAIVASSRELGRLREGAAAWSNADAALKVVRACEHLLRARQAADQRYRATAIAGSADVQD